MYGHRCQDTQSPFRVRAESSRVSFPQITKVCWQRVIIQCVWLISIKWWHKILYCYRPSRLSHFEHPEVGPGVRAVRPGGDSLTCTRRERERERTSPDSREGRPVELEPEPGPPLPDSWLPESRRHQQWREPGADPVSHQRDTEQATSWGPDNYKSLVSPQESQSRVINLA